MKNFVKTFVAAAVAYNLVGTRQFASLFDGYTSLVQADARVLHFNETYEVGNAALIDQVQRLENAIESQLRGGEEQRFSHDMNHGHNSGQTTRTADGSTSSVPFKSESIADEENPAAVTIEPTTDANPAPSSADSNNNLLASSDGKLTCKSLMQSGNPSYQDGYFLTNESIPISWHKRADGSRHLEHSMCELHQYTAEEAKKCLAGKHINFLGDSLTRYQFMSMVWFLHKGSYPPHFPSPQGKRKCEHIDEEGNETCSPKDQPNICVVPDWIDKSSRYSRGREGNQWFTQSVGSTLFDGRMEASAVKIGKMKHFHIVDNFLYVSPSASKTARIPQQEQRPHQDQVFVSYVKETGWGEDPNPINGFDFTGCAFEGTCEYSDELSDARVARAFNKSFDFAQDLAQALDKENDGIIPQVLPKIDIALYNRGIWGQLSKERANTILPLLYKATHPKGGPHGKCFFRTTTEYKKSTVTKERSFVQEAALNAGCGYIDFGYIVREFAQTGWENEERKLLLFDGVHFHPWVYEELNNLFLNVLCNGRTDGTKESS